MGPTRGSAAAGARWRPTLVVVVSALALLGLPLGAVLPAAAADPPVVDAVYDNFGPEAGGQLVSIVGHGFTGATGVRFGVATPAASFTVIDDTTIQALTPAAPTPPAPVTLVNVFVDGAGGSSVEGQSSWYRYLAPPRITAATPATSSFEGGQVVDLTVTGMQDFDWVRNAYVDGLAAWNFTYTEISDPMTIRFYTPPHVAGVAKLAIESGGGRSNEVDLTYLDTPLPRIASFTPTQGPISGGTALVVGGSGFTGTTEVSFDDVPAASFTVVSDNQLTVVTPAVPSARFSGITVRTPAGLSPTALSGFEFQGPPVVTGVTPANGPPTGGTVVEIHGAGMAAATAVRFGDTPATWYHFDDWTLRAIAPAHAAAVVQVVVENAQGPSTDPVTFDYTTTGPPTVDRVTPNHGPQAGGYPVVVEGSGFSTTTAVTFDGWYHLPATFTVVSDSQLTVVVPASTVPSVYDIHVTNAHGTNVSTLGDWFRYDQPPYVSALSRSGGSTEGGYSIDVNGAVFTGATAVRFGDVPATSFTVLNDNAIQVVVPPHAVGAVVITVTSPYGTSSTVMSKANRFDYVAPGVPVVQSLDVRDALEVGGGVVHIFAIDADRTTGVRFGDVPATSFTVIDELNVEATIPPHAPGMVDVVLESAAGPSQPNEATSFTFVAVPPPYVYGGYPNVGPLTGGTSVAISGFGFVDVSSVTFGGVPATSFTVDSANQITAVTPPSTATDDQQVDIVVTTPLGASTTNWQTTFTYQAVHPLELLYITPARGSIFGGAQVTIYGRGLTDTSAVLFGDGIPAISFTVRGDYQVDVVVPAVPDPYLYNVTVVTPAGSTPASSSSWFLYLAPPQVWGMSRYQGLTSGGEQVTITGDQLLGVSNVMFGDTYTGFEVVDNHTIIATAPPCAAGLVSVRVYGEFGYSETTLGSLYTYRTPGTPAIRSVTPNRGTVAGGDTVVITGSGFTGATSVRFDDGILATSFHVDSDTQITAVAPPRPDPVLVNVYVDNPVGSSAPGPASWYLYT